MCTKYCVFSLVFHNSDNHNIVTLITGAWERVDDVINSESDASSHEFDDDYDPVAEADKVGQAFGDYKQIKKKRKERAQQPVSTKFDDTYNPEVDPNDPLARAFGDGYRTAKPKEVCCYFRM